MKKLTGLDVYKLLPRTNCGDCGFSTCMAFAMQVAAKRAALDQCPHVSQAAKEALGEAQAPPMRTVQIGQGPRAIAVGGETGSSAMRKNSTAHAPSVSPYRMIFPWRSSPSAFGKLQRSSLFGLGRKLG